MWKSLYKQNYFIKNKIKEMNVLKYKRLIIDKTPDKYTMEIIAKYFLRFVFALSCDNISTPSGPV